MSVCAEEQRAIDQYLDYCGGSDLLVFEDSDEATAAVRALRRDYPELIVKASYNRVRISKVD